MFLMLEESNTPVFAGVKRCEALSAPWSLPVSRSFGPRQSLLTHGLCASLS